MFGKRTTFGGNTPGLSEAPRPVASPAPAPAPAPPQRRASDGDGMSARMRTTDEVLDVRAPADAQRDGDEGRHETNRDKHPKRPRFKPGVKKLCHSAPRASGLIMWIGAPSA